LVTESVQFGDIYMAKPSLRIKMFLNGQAKLRPGHPEHGHWPKSNTNTHTNTHTE